MKKQFVFFIIGLLLSVLTLQAQPNEPQLKTCESLIRKLNNASTDYQKAEALAQLAKYCRANGLFDEGALIGQLALPIYSKPIEAAAKNTLKTLPVIGNGRGMDESISNESNYAKKQLEPLLSTLGENASESTYFRNQAAGAFNTAASMQWWHKRDGGYVRVKVLEGDYFRRIQDLPNAEKSYQKALKQAENSSLKPHEVAALMNKLVIINLMNLKYKKAAKLLNELPRSDSPSNPSPGFEAILCTHATMAVIKKDYTTAAKLTRRAAERYMSTLQPTKLYTETTLKDFLECFSLIARCYKQQNKLTEAMQVYTQMRYCLVATLGAFLPYFLEEDLLYLNGLLQPWYNEVQSFAAPYTYLPGMTTFMYDNVQMMKQFFLRSPSIYSAKMSTLQADPYLRQVRHRMEKWLPSEKSQNSFRKGDLLPITLINLRINALSRDAMRYIRSRMHEEYNCKAKWKDVQQRTATNEVMVEFLTIPQQDKEACRYAALVFTREDTAPHYIDLCGEEELREALNSPGRRNFFLLNTILKPLQRHFGNKSVVTIFPTGLLSTVSFAGIIDQKNTYLCQKYRLSYQLSGTDRLRMTYNSLPKGKTAVLFGGADYGLPPSRMADRVRGQGFHYLPHSRAEVITIADILKKRECSVSLYTGKQATETAFRSISDLDCSPFILHLSTHGFYLPHVPKGADNTVESKARSDYFNPLMRTGLAFTGANESWRNDSKINLPNDGITTGHEITGMSLMNTELVVLSACNSGLGDIRDGEGVYGLQRAFRYAGARSMIMSLSEVPDKETAEFMSLFYLNWSNDTPKSNAFHSVQIYMAKKYPASPEKWAGFILME